MSDISLDHPYADGHPSRYSPNLQFLGYWKDPNFDPERSRPVPAAYDGNFGNPTYERRLRIWEMEVAAQRAMPDVRDHTGTAGTPNAALVRYLTLGTTYATWRSGTACRVCGEYVGRRCLTDGRWVWPEGLAHYVEVHGVALPAPFAQTPDEERLKEEEWHREELQYIEARYETVADMGGQDSERASLMGHWRDETRRHYYAILALDPEFPIEKPYL